MDAIVSNLASYAAKTDQAKPAGQPVGDYVRSNMQLIERYGYPDVTLGYLEGLDKATGERPTPPL